MQGHSGRQIRREIKGGQFWEKVGKKVGEKVEEKVEEKIGEKVGESLGEIDKLNLCPPPPAMIMITDSMGFFLKPSISPYTP